MFLYFLYKEILYYWCPNGLCLWNAGETPRDENAFATVEYLKSIPHVSVSMIWEALSVRSG